MDTAATPVKACLEVCGSFVLTELPARAEAMSTMGHGGFTAPLPRRCPVMRGRDVA